MTVLPVLKHYISSLSFSRHLSPTSTRFLLDFCYRCALVLGLNLCICWLLLQNKNLKHLSSITQKSMHMFINLILEVTRGNSLSSVWGHGAWVTDLLYSKWDHYGLMEVEQLLPKKVFLYNNIWAKVQRNRFHVLCWVWKVTWQTVWI